MKSFDVAFQCEDRWNHFEFTNNRRGFKALLKHLGGNDHCVMEASGPYYLQLATFLYENKTKTSVINPLVIRRFSQMQLNRAKTDKKDAQLIAQYGMRESPDGWEPEDESIVHLRQMMALSQLITTQIGRLKNQLHAFKSTGLLSNEVKSTLNSVIRSLQTKKDKMEREMDVLALKSYEQTISRLVSIPGIGRKTAILLVILSNNFQKFDNYKQLIAYVGLSPRIYQSGSSVKGKGHVCKMGNRHIRKNLYLCTWTAKFVNKGCVSMYERLKQKGKPEKVIKVALANKLLKQAFSIAKNQTMYLENYSIKPCF